MSAAQPDLAALPPALQAALAAEQGRAVTQAQPVLVHSIGVPGAGKSSLLAALMAQLAAQLTALPHHLVAFDRLMQQMPDYQTEAQQNPSMAFARHEMTARAAGYALLQILLARRAHILFDHSGAHPDHPALLRQAKQLGYRIMLVHVTTAETEAAQRLVQREADEGRHTPPHYIGARAALIDGLLPSYRQIADDYIAIANPDLPAPQRETFFTAQAAQLCAAWQRGPTIPAQRAAS